MQIDLLAVYKRGSASGYRDEAKPSPDLTLLLGQLESTNVMSGLVDPAS